jgi:lysophospholipase L1-like esterase
MVTAWGTTDVTIYVDRKPLTVDPYLVPAGQWFVVAEGLGGGAHLVEFIIGWGANFLQVVTPPATSVTIGPAPAFKIGITGDSYTDSGVAPYFAGLSREIWRLTGWTPIQLGQGSTGYTNNGHNSGDTTKSVYGSTSRLAALEAANPDVVLVVGSVNDGAATPSVVEQAATDYYAALAPRPVIVVGVEPLFDAGDPNYVAWDLVNAAILAAADAAPNVIGVIDWRGEDWLTGTGSVSNPQGDGNQDIYIGDPAGIDTIHPNYQGQKYLGGRLVERVGPMPLSDVATIGDLDFRVPLPPASGSYRLHSVDGTPQWVAL